MSLSCECSDFDEGADWYFRSAEDFTELDTKRSRKCCSCKSKLTPGTVVLKLQRWRSPREDCNYLEERIYGDEVPMPAWYMCEKCGGLYMSVSDLGFCCDISENIAEQILEYRTEEEHHKSRHSVSRNYTG